MDFFAELQQLREKVPHPCILTVNSENSDYCPYHARGKNCYLIIGHQHCEDCYYGFWVGSSMDCVDCAFTEKSEVCFECIDSRDCYSSNYCQDCISCSFAEFCYDCKGCQSCFGCVNLRNKQYHIFNKSYSKEDYAVKVKELRKRYYPAAAKQKFRELPEFRELLETLPHNYLQGFQNENVVGEHIFHARNCYYCFDVNEAEDCYYIFNGFRIKDSMDMCYTGLDAEMNYMCHSAVTLYNSNFCNICWYSQNLEYCEYVYNSHDCFGCVSRNHAEYEILNQKYGKDDYFKKIREIKEQSKKDGTYGRWWWPSPYEEPSSYFMMPSYKKLDIY